MLCTSVLQTPWQHIRSLSRHHHRDAPHPTTTYRITPYPRTISTPRLHTSAPPRYALRTAPLHCPHATCISHPPRRLRLTPPCHTSAAYHMRASRITPPHHVLTLQHLHATPSARRPCTATHATGISHHTAAPPSHATSLPLTATCGSRQLTSRPTAHRHTLRMHGRRRLGLQWHLSHRAPPVLLQLRHTPVPRHTSAAYHMRLAHHTSTPRPHASALTRYALRTAPLHYPSRHWHIAPHRGASVSRHLTPAHATCVRWRLGAAHASRLGLRCIAIRCGCMDVDGSRHTSTSL